MRLPTCTHVCSALYQIKQSCTDHCVLLTCRPYLHRLETNTNISRLTSRTSRLEATNPLAALKLRLCNTQLGQNMANRVDLFNCRSVLELLRRQTTQENSDKSSSQASWRCSICSRCLESLRIFYLEYRLQIYLLFDVYYMKILQYYVVEEYVKKVKFCGL